MCRAAQPKMTLSERPVSIGRKGLLPHWAPIRTTCSSPSPRRGLNQDLQIVARASRADSITNLDRAGADHVISPHQIGGLRMAMSATRPLVVDFLDSLLMSSDDDSQHITEVLVTEGSPLSTGPIGSVRAPLDVHVLAIRRGGEIIVYPDEDQPCLPGDSAILVGVSRALSSFEGRSR